MRHCEKPEISDLTDSELKEMIEKATSSDYYKYVSELIPITKGKVVKSALSGNSGFLLQFTDNSWVNCFLQNDSLQWKFGENEIDNSSLDLIKNNKFGNGRKEISEDLPYADEQCLIGEELEKSFGKEIKGLAIGEKNFNFCFPNKMELDVMFFHDAEGKLTLRVFWEQW